MKRDAGQISVLVIGFMLVVSLVAVVVVNASAAYLQRQSLGNLADGAALAAADAMRADQVYERGVDSLTDVPLDPERAAVIVAEYLAVSGGDFEDVRWAIDSFGDAIVVRLESRLDMPLVPPGWMDSSTVVAESTGRLRVN